MIYIVDFTALI